MKEETDTIHSYGSRSGFDSLNRALVVNLLVTALLSRFQMTSVCEILEKWPSAENSESQWSTGFFDENSITMSLG